jgi:hypothetical protein
MPDYVAGFAGSYIGPQTATTAPAQRARPAQKRELRGPADCEQPDTLSRKGVIFQRLRNQVRVAVTGKAG